VTRRRARPGASRALVVAAATALLVAACSRGGEDATGGVGGTPSDEPAVDFTLLDLTGNPVRLADFRGQTVVLDFWATWCPPCVFQIPELNKLWDAHRAAGDVVVLGVAVDAEGAEVVGPWAEEQGVNYPLVIGDESLAREFGAMGFPTLVIVAPDGRIHSRHVGLIDVEDLEKLVAEVPRPSST